MCTYFQRDLLTVTVLSHRFLYTANTLTSSSSLYRFFERENGHDFNLHRASTSKPTNWRLMSSRSLSWIFSPLVFESFNKQKTTELINNTNQCAFPTSPSFIQISSKHFCRLSQATRPNTWLINKENSPTTSSAKFIPCYFLASFLFFSGKSHSQQPQFA